MRQLLYSLCFLVLILSFSAKALKGVTTRWDNDNPTPLQTEFDNVPLQEIKQAANSGNDSAQLYLGQAYEIGDQVELDYYKAKSWYQKSAEQGNKYAQDKLGWMHESGNMPFQNIATSARWYRKAADQGYAPAQNSLAFTYKRSGTQLGYQKAMDLYKKSAQQGFAPAQRNIGLLYANGQGVKLDYTKAKHWYLLAANNGDGAAANFLGLMYQDGLGVKQNKKTAKEWFQKAAENNNYQGMQNYLALNKLTYQQADTLAKSGDPNAQLQLCHMYFNGDEIDVNYKKAVHWCTQSAIGGQINAQQDLARMFFGGLIVKQSYESAYVWAKIASTNNRDMDSLLNTLTQELSKEKTARAEKAYRDCLNNKLSKTNCPIPTPIE
ncbi:SEL1-like repeat protein [Vibrio aquimaris]|uniref:Beta-lactamase HcpD n=1 Tax=Vibrio aquimaris TaxID=2587862 RepID=A0A5P9CN93_9VIBR|nr:SEL1-like repeat protein [Vibrio aquimaris]QFT27715.1 Putative beta-lactamase HcpD precursor [Vibrio aquimaris]